MPRPEEDGVRLDAPAKVNLFLRVLVREEGGYHQLETLFQALELADRLQIRPDPEPGVHLRIRGPAADGLLPDDTNLASRAARHHLEALPRGGWPAPGVRIELEKRIPHGAGLGGGSSDAAAVLRGMNALARTPLPLDRILAIGGALGTDVPFFASGAPRALAWGRGDRILPLPALAPRPVVVALPPVRVSTPAAYGRLAELRREAGTGYAGAGTPGNLADWQGVARAAWNDFGPAIEAVHPACLAIRAALEEAGATMALLSGSGSAVFGVFADEGGAEAGRLAATAAAPGVKVFLSQTRTGSASVRVP